MKKLRLDLDSLAVEAFEADAPRGARGTVAAHAPETAPRACPPTLDWYCTEGGAYCTSPAGCVGYGFTYDPAHCAAP